MPSHSIVDAFSRRVAVIGPGLMGLGIAQTLAAAGVEIALCGRSLDAARAGRERLAASLHRQVARGRLAADDEAAVLSRVEVGIATQDVLNGCGIIIESVPEDRALKTEVLAAIEVAVAPEAIIATNTSGLPITGLAKALNYPSRFLGLHFFSPAERMLLVEVVRGPQTSEATTAAALGFLHRIGKRPVLVHDGPGFFATRVFAAYLDEAAAMVGEGIAPALIEESGIANGRALGPLSTLDETGLGLNLQQARQARADGLEARFCRTLAEPVLARLVERGRGGRRGGGFFDWPRDGPKRLWPGLAVVFPAAATQPGLEAVRLRLLVAEAHEALRCLEEGAIASADDADVASVLGLGFPKSVGGVARWAEGLGLAEFVRACDRLATAHGERFAPSPWLRALAERGVGLTEYRQVRSVA